MQKSNTKSIYHYFRIDCVPTVKYRIQYSNGRNTNLSSKTLFSACMELAKRVKNANCDTKFYQAAMAKDAALGDEDHSGQRKLSFEADTSIITPFDFMKLFLTFQADQIG